MRIFCLQGFLVVALSFLCLPVCFSMSEDDKSEIPLQGKWGTVERPERSLPSFSVRAYTDGLGMDVRIENEWDEVMIRRTVSEAESVCVTVSIESLPAGSYTLVLENGDKGCLEGEFEKR